jgi:hypothetical protein
MILSKIDWDFRQGHFFQRKYLSGNKETQKNRKLCERFFATMHAEAKFLIFLAKHCKNFPLKLFHYSLQNGM